MGQWVGAQGWAQTATNAHTCPHCDATSRKPTSKANNFFSITTRRLAESVEGLNSSLALAAGKLQDCKALQKKWRTRDLNKR